MTTPIETNARLLIGVMAKHFPNGGTCEDLRRQFEKNTGLVRQSFYNALRYAKEQGWFVGGGMHQLYSLNPDGCWKEPDQSIGEQLEKVQRDNDRLEYLAKSQTRQLEKAQLKIERLLDWRSGSDVNGKSNVALVSLIRTVSDDGASLRQRLEAAAAVFANEVLDAGILDFVRGFLESLCVDVEIATDYRTEAAKLLRRYQAPRVVSDVVRPAYRTNDEPAEPPPEPLHLLVERQRRRAYPMQQQMVRELGLPAAGGRNGNSDDSDTAAG